MKTDSVSPSELWHDWRRRRDQASFEALVLPEMRYAADLARRMGASEAEAEDVVQDSLMRLAGEKSDDPIRVGVRAWLCRRVVLCYKMHVRSAVRRRKHEGAVLPRQSATTPGYRAEVRDRVEKAIARLDADERQAVLLRYLEDLDYREMSYVLGISEGACRVRVHRGIGRLRKHLGTKAGALIAALGVPAFAAEAAVVSAAAGSVAGGTLATLTAVLTGKVAVKLAAALLMVGAAATGVIVATGGRTTEPVPPVEVAVGRPESVPTPPPPEKPEAARREPPPIDRPIPRFASARELMEDHFSGRRDATLLFWHFDELARLIPAPRDKTIRVEARGEVTDVYLRRLAENAGRIVLGPGTFRVKEGVFRPPGLPVEIRGAGMDRTTLIAPEADLLFTTETAHGLIVRDLTFEGFEGPRSVSGDFINARGTVTALVERVRFGNWHPWAGGAAPVLVTGRALLAFRDCEFLGAHKQSGGGNALTVRGDVLALFDRCLFSDVDEVVGLNGAGGASPRSLVHLRDCRYVDCHLTGTRLHGDASPAIAVRVRGADIAWGRSHMSDEWKLETWAHAEFTDLYDLRWSDGPVRGTVGELKNLLANVTATPGERITLVRKVAWPDWRRPGFILFLQDPDEHVRTLLVRTDAGSGRIVSREEVLFPRAFDLELEPGEPGLREMLRGKIERIKPDQPCLGIHIRRGRDDGKLVLNTYPSGAVYFDIEGRMGLVLREFDVRLPRKNR